MLKNDCESQNFPIFEEVVHNFGRSDKMRPQFNSLLAGLDITNSIHHAATCYFLPKSW